MLRAVIGGKRAAALEDPITLDYVVRLNVRNLALINVLGVRSRDRDHHQELKRSRDNDREGEITRARKSFRRTIGDRLHRPFVETVGATDK